MLIRLGREGYSSIMKNIYTNCDYLVQGLKDLGHFEILSDTRPEKGLPVIAFKLNKHENNRHFDEFDLSQRLRESKWIVPAYKMAKNAENINLLRVGKFYLLF